MHGNDDIGFGCKKFQNSAACCGIVYWKGIKKKMKNIGGQAVIEGVMMKSPKGWTVAVRDTKGDISLKTVKTKKTPALLKLPVIRGVVGIFNALSIGIKAIEFSGSVAYQEKEGDKPISPLGMAISISLAIVLAIALFKFLPLLLTAIIGDFVRSVSNSSVLFNLIDGLFRIGIFCSIFLL